MAIQTSIKRSFFYWNLVYLVLCGGLGAWGAYDYWVTIPDKYVAVAEYEELTEEQRELEARSEFITLRGKLRSGELSEDDKMRLEELRAMPAEVMVPLTEDDRTRYEAINEILLVDFENTPPQMPASYDGWVNFYVYFIGCGVLGAPWFVWKLFSRRGLCWTLEDDGTLVTPDGSYSMDQITGIDMSIWMKKSIAKVNVEGADDVELDDYENQDAFKIVGVLAHRFHPDEWTEEAKLVKVEEDSEEEAEEEAASEDAGTGESDSDQAEPASDQERPD